MTSQALTFRRPRRAATLVELLAALAVSMILVAAMASAFIQIIRASDEAEAQVRASNSARLAVDSLINDLAAVTQQSGQVFILIDRPLTYGDRLDNDADATADEEVFDGRDSDGDWQVARDDRFATVGVFTERTYGIGIDDYGDDRVDEDCLFSNDEVSWTVPASVSDSGTDERVTYAVGAFDGEDHVLLKTVVTNINGTTQTTTIEPLIFDVLSLDILAWNSNSTSPFASRGSGYWTTSWDSGAIGLPLVVPFSAPSGVPPFEVPSAFLVSVVVNADRFPLAELPDPATSTGPMKTMRVSTVVGVESVLLDPRYVTYVRNP